MKIKSENVQFCSKIRESTDKVSLVAELENICLVRNRTGSKLLFLSFSV